MQDYSIVDVPETTRVAYTESVALTDIYSLTGHVTMNLWGGGTGGYPAADDEWTQPSDEPLTKAAIFAHVTDDGFGCESLESCEVDVERHAIVTRVYEDCDKTTKHDTTFLVFNGCIESSELPPK